MIAAGYAVIVVAFALAVIALRRAARIEARRRQP